jgi:hypothetical protein
LDYTAIPYIATPMKTQNKQNNRELMPGVAKMIDEFTAVFGPGMKVLWAKEGGIELGVPIDRSKMVTPNIAVDEPEDIGKTKNKKRKR